MIFSLFLLVVQTLSVGFFSSFFCFPLRIYLFLSLVYAPFSFVCAIFAYEIIWWSAFGLMTPLHGLALSLMLLLWRMFITYVSFPPVAMSFCVATLSLVSLIPVFRWWTVWPIVVTLSIAFMLTQWFYRYGRQSRAS